MNEPELGAGIDPGMAFNPFQSSILDKMRRDLNPQPLDRESSLLTTRPDLCPSCPNSSDEDTKSTILFQAEGEQQQQQRTPMFTLSNRVRSGARPVRRGDEGHRAHRVGHGRLADGSRAIQVKT
jgi:hypothetical protein